MLAYAPITLDQLVLMGSCNEALKASLELKRALSGSIYVCNPDSLVGIWKGGKVIPSLWILFNCLHYVLWSLIGGAYDALNLRKNLRVHKTLALKPYQALDVGSGDSAARVSWGEALDSVQRIKRLDCAVYPAKAKGLLDCIIVAYARLAGLLHGKDKPSLAFTLEVLSKPGTPLRAVAEAQYGALL